MNRKPAYEYELFEIAGKYGFGEDWKGLLVDLYISGMSQRQVARVFGRTQPWVGRYLHESGADVRPRGGRNNPFGRGGKHELSELSQHDASA